MWKHQLHTAVNHHHHQQQQQQQQLLQHFRSLIPFSSFPKTRMIGSDQIHHLQLEIGDFWPWWSLMWKVEDHTGTCQDHHLAPKNLQSWRQMTEKLKAVVYSYRKGCDTIYVWEMYVLCSFQLCQHICQPQMFFLGVGHSKTILLLSIY